jgi:hypothetical protein
MSLSIAPGVLTHWDVPSREGPLAVPAGLLATEFDLMPPGPVVSGRSEPSPRVARSSDRAISTAEAGIRRSGGRNFRVRIFDLSPRGCKMEFVERPEIGERVWVKFDALQGIAGRVRWVAGHVGGVQFEPAMHEAVFHNLMA